METDQLLVFATLGGVLVLFIWGRWRYDLVAVAALLFLALTGVVPASEAFAGFGHPAVITVAAVLVVSRGLQNSGLVDVIAAFVGRWTQAPLVHLTVLTVLVALLSGFMNNVGALALLMPVAIRIARRTGSSPSLFLMPLAFGSLLGGMTTLIGTPPNIIISSFRARENGEVFRMFDFFPVGGIVLVAGLLFIVAIGWRLIPHRKTPSSKEELFKIEDYTAEVVAPEGADCLGKTVSQLENAAEGGVAILRLARGGTRLIAPSDYEEIREGDVLLVEADAESLNSFLSDNGLKLSGNAAEPGSHGLKTDASHDTEGPQEEGSKEPTQVEAVVAPGSILVNRTAAGVSLRHRYGVNLLGIARHGGSVAQRISRTPLRVGDVLLLEGKEGTIAGSISDLGCLPLAERPLRIGAPRRVFAAVGIFAVAIALAALGIVSAPIALSGAAFTAVMVSMVPFRRVYEAIDWPVIVLLGAMIPVGVALENTGGAKTIADSISTITHGMSPVVALVVVLLAAMFLSDLMNNAAAAVFMAPVGISVAKGIGASADPFLMAIAVGASCAFLTPIGHQSNTLVMGPGGYQFRDYWRMGLPLEVVIVAVSVPAILLIWPL